MHAFDDDRTNLWFLLSIAPLTLGCPGDDAVGGDGSSGASSSGTTTMTSLTSMGPGPVSTTSGADGTGGSTGGTTGGTTSAATSSTGGSSSSGMPGESSSSSEATSSTGGSESSGGSGSSGSTGGSESSGGSSGGSSESSGGSSESSGGSTGPALTPCEAYGALVSYCYNPAEGAYVEMYCDQYQMYLAMNYGPACVAAFEDFVVCLSTLTCPEFMGGMPVCVAEDAAFLAAC